MIIKYFPGIVPRVPVGQVPANTPIEQVGNARFTATLLKLSRNTERQNLIAAHCRLQPLPTIIVTRTIAESEAIAILLDCRAIQAKNMNDAKRLEAIQELRESKFLAMNYSLFSHLFAPRLDFDTHVVHTSYAGLNQGYINAFLNLRVQEFHQIVDNTGITSIFNRMFKTLNNYRVTLPFSVDQSTIVKFESARRD